MNELFTHALHDVDGENMVFLISSNNHLLTLFYNYGLAKLNITNY